MKIRPVAGVLTRVLPVFLMAFPVSVSAEPQERFKQLAGPPGEMRAMAAPDPLVSAQRSNSALLPVTLEKGAGDRWRFNSDISIGGDVHRFALFSGEAEGSQKSWTVMLRDPVTSKLRSAEALGAERRAIRLSPSEGSAPGDVFSFRNVNSRIGEIVIESDRPGKGLLLIEGAGPVRLVSRQAAFNQRVGQRIRMLAYISEGDANETRRAGDIHSAVLRVTTPDAQVLPIVMFDDGLHGDGEAGDGVYASDFLADRAGSFSAQVIVSGQGRDGEKFVRTAQHLIPVVEDIMSLKTEVATSRMISTNRLEISVDVSAPRAVGHYRVFAEVWGTDPSAAGASIPVAWIGGMTNYRNGQLSVGLDTRWIERSGAQPPFELRTLRIEDPDHFITLASKNRVSIATPSASPLSFPRSEVAIDEEMLMGPRPEGLEAAGKAHAPVPNAYTQGTGHKLLLVHGYCSSDVWGSVSGQFANSAVFSDFGQNRTLDQFAVNILDWGIGWNSYAIVAHSQGGMAALHLYVTRWSGLDNAGPGRLLQSVGTPYQGTNIAGNWATFYQYVPIWGGGCGANDSLTYAGAAAWLGGVPLSFRAKVNYYTTSFLDDAGYDYCSGADLLLTDPDDGVVEQTWAQLPGATNRGHTTSQCHSTGMREPAQYLDSGRNSVMSLNAAVGPPVLVTGTATGVGQFTAILNGTVNPSGASTTTAFEYGATTSYGSSVNAQTRSGFTSQSISASVSNLQCGTTYNFRATGTNSAGTRNGSNWLFTTTSCSPPTVTTGSATSVIQNSATLNGTVNPNGSSTSTSFEYGTNTSYGNSVSAQTRSGTTTQSISASISNLVACTLYHFRAKGTNSGGPANGSDQTFTTSCTPPTVTTGSASSIGQNSATLNGTVNPNGSSTSTSFEYGTTTSYGNSVGAQTRSGTTSQSISASITNLVPCMLYHFRANGTNSGGPASGSDATFTTGCSPPSVSTSSASSVGQDSATLNGTVNPNGSSTTTSFEYGTTTAYGSSVASQNLSGTTTQPISASVSNLPACTSYHFRAKGTNAGGPADGLDATFTTTGCVSPPPAVATGSASSVGQNTATLNGTVNPNGSSTTTSFDYGTTSAYGNSVAAQTLTGSTPQSISASLSNLTACTLYHFRAKGTNAGGSTEGSDATFTTTGSNCSGPTASKGDFTNDGKPDILWRNMATGENLLWTMDGFTQVSFSTYPTVTDLNWKVQAVGDYNADSKSDLVWRNSVSGQNVTWFMDGSTMLGFGYPPDISDANWTIQASGDLNRDGQFDLLWRNAANGLNVWWYMSGANLAQWGFLPDIADPAWKMYGSGDLDADGKWDLVWRNSSNGLNVLWMLNGNAFDRWAFMPDITDSNWKIQAVADYNRDGKADLIWRNMATGQNVYWIMNGPNLVSYGFLPTVSDLNWQIVGPR